MELDFVERQKMRAEARDAGLERAALVLDEAVLRLWQGSKRGRLNQVDSHVEDVLKRQAAMIRSLKSENEERTL